MLVVNTIIHLINVRNMEHIKIAKISFKPRRKPENTQSWILSLWNWYLTRTSRNFLSFKTPQIFTTILTTAHHRYSFSATWNFPTTITYFLKTNFNATFSFTPSYPREVSRIKFSLNFSLSSYVLRVQTCSFLTCYSVRLTLCTASFNIQKLCVLPT
jgi:hypothetical protein